MSGKDGSTVSWVQNLRTTYLAPCCCCCSAYLSFCHHTASDANLLDDLHTFQYNDYFMIRGITTCLGVSGDPMFLWISSNSCPLNLLLIWSHQGEIIIVKHLIQGHNVTRVRVEPRPFDQSRRKNDVFTHSATLNRTVPACRTSVQFLKRTVPMYRTPYQSDSKSLGVPYRTAILGVRITKKLKYTGCCCPRNPNGKAGNEEKKKKEWFRQILGWIYFC